MASIPLADIDINPDVVVALLEEQCPDLAGLPLEFFSRGWDNEIYRLGDDLLVRLPRREIATQLIRSEQQWLPRIAPHLTAEVPAPVFMGEPGSRFPRPWSIVPYLPGTRMTEVPVPVRTRSAATMAAFFTSLHTPAPPDAPRNAFRRGPLTEVAPRWGARIAQAPGFGSRALRRWRAWHLAPPHNGSPRWVHGDAHPLNLLLDNRGELAAVLDWGDVTAGDPAVDLATAWLSFDQAGRTIFVERMDASGRYDQAAWTRAKAWALGFAALFVTHSDDLPELAAVGRHAASQLLGP